MKIKLFKVVKKKKGKKKKKKKKGVEFRSVYHHTKFERKKSAHRHSNTVQNKN